MTEKIAILNVDDQPVWCIGMAAVINAQPDMEVVAHASTGREAIEFFLEKKADIILMNLTLPDMSGVDAMTTIRADLTDARFIIISSFARDNEIRQALVQGARAYMLKSMPPSEVVDVIRQVHAGKKKIPVQVAEHLAEYHNDDTLTGREVDVLRHLGDGNRNRDIAKKLLIGEETVKAHMRNIMQKLRAKDRTQALAIALQRGILQL